MKATVAEIEAVPFHSHHKNISFLNRSLKMFIKYKRIEKEKQEKSISLINGKAKHERGENEFECFLIKKNDFYVIYFQSWCEI